MPSVFCYIPSQDERGELVIIWWTTWHLVLCAHGLRSLHTTIDEGVEYSHKGNLSSLGQVARSILVFHVKRASHRKVQCDVVSQDYGKYPRWRRRGA